MASPQPNRRAGGSRRRCLPGSLGRTLLAGHKPLAAAAATAVSVPHLILPAMPAAVACETKERLDHLGTVLLPAGAVASLVTSGGPCIDPCRSREEGERAGRAGLPGEQCADQSSDRFAQPSDVGSAWTDSRKMTGCGLLLVSAFLSTASDSAAPGDRWSIGDPQRRCGSQI